MKKNKKGFTLIELLAVIVIMGILALVAVPNIVGLVGGNKSKAYVEDAKKLISRAQYMINANNTKIERPDPNDCIVLSLGYLDDGSFDSPPNNGKYLPDSSFVIVKNLGNNEYDYSVMLVEGIKNKEEKVKDDKYPIYKGVDLSTLDQLNASNSKSRVKTFSEDEVLYVDEDSMIAHGVSTSSGRLLTKEKINNKINGYINGDADIVDVYTIDNTEVSEKNKNSGPKIDNIIVNSKSKDKLEVVVDVSDNNSEGVYLCINYSPEKGSYPDPKNCDKKNLKDDGKDDDSYKENFNITSEYNKGLVWIYVLVYDNFNNTDKKMYKYSIYKNRAPRIDSVSIDKRPFDKENMNIARIYLNVTDDLDLADDIQVCISNKKEEDSCKNYDSYSKMFPDVNDRYYDYMVSETLDGKKHDVYVYVKDSAGSEVISNLLEYQEYANKAPKINSVSVSDLPYSSENNEDVSNNSNILKSKKGRIRVDVSDDLDSISDLKVCVSRTNNCADDKYKNFFDVFSDDGDGYYTDFQFSDVFDGESHDAYLFVKDTYGLITKNGSDQPIAYTVYQNEAPEFVEVKVNPIDMLHKYHINSSKNSLNVEIDLAVKDDINDDDNINVYIRSRQHEEIYKYSEIVTMDNIDFYMDTKKNNFNGKDRVIYIMACDGIRGDSNTKCSSYEDITISNIYETVTPEISGKIGVESSSEDYNSSVVKLGFSGNINDDLDNLDNIDNSFEVSNQHQNDEELDDNSYVVDEETGEQIHIEDSYKIAICYKINDKDTCTDYYAKEYLIKKYGEDSNLFPLNIDEYDGQDVKFYLKIKHVLVESPYVFDDNKYSTNYKLYKKCDDVVDYSEMEVQEGFEEITTDSCNGQCFLNNDTQIQSNYFKFTWKVDAHLTVNSSNAPVYCTNEKQTEEIENVGCDFFTCVGKPGEIVENVIGTTPYDVTGDWKWKEYEYDSEGKKIKTYNCTQYYKFYQVTIKSAYAIARPYNPEVLALCASDGYYEDHKDLFSYKKNDENNSFIRINDGPSNNNPNAYSFIRIDDSGFVEAKIENSPSAEGDSDNE